MVLNVEKWEDNEVLLSEYSERSAASSNMFHDRRVMPCRFCF